jgi:PEGA domain-containing protein
MLLTRRGRLPLPLFVGVSLFVMGAVVRPASAAGFRVHAGPHGVRASVNVTGGVIGGGGYGDDDWSSSFLGPAYLIVDARPAEAQVLLDGSPVGTAGELVAHAMPLEPGEHAVEIAASGFRSYVAVFDADPMFPTRIRVVLPPARDRRPEGRTPQP